MTIGTAAAKLNSFGFYYYNTFVAGNASIKVVASTNVNAILF